MFIESKVSGINIVLPALPESKNAGALIPVIFLHGFTGSSADWKQFMKQLPERFFPVALDLPGHGKSLLSDKSSQYGAGGIAESILSITEFLQMDKPVLTGYSMGGRAALCFAAAYPALLKGLFLESTTPGIADQNERMQRIQSDEMLAIRIENGIEDFADYWMDLPLFHSQKSLPSDELKKIRERKIENSAQGLAASLRLFGTGIMPHLWDDLHRINCPVRLVTGSLDKKFTDINSRMVKLLPHARHLKVDNAGHNIHLERPEVFLHLLNDFLNTII